LRHNAAILNDARINIVFPAALLFDLDGTLIDSEREAAESMARALQKGLGVVVDQDDRDFVVGRSWVTIYQRLCQRYPQLTWPRDEMIARTVAERDAVMAEFGLTILPGARELLQRTAQTPRALVTGSSRAEAAMALRDLGDMATFLHVIAAEDVERSKPDPLGYLRAADKLNVAPIDCVVIEDSQAGIAAGRAAGCTVIAVSAGAFGKWDQTAADHVVATLHDITPSFLASCRRSA
jgi:HAD superfamily hydrolase (TIGR01509 family)